MKSYNIFFVKLKQVGFKLFVTLLSTSLLLGILGFVIYPYLPKVLEFKSELSRINPQDLGYNTAMQIMVTLAPPKYELAQDVLGDESKVQMIEDVSGVDKTANLEALDTKLKIPSVNIDGLVVDGVEQGSMLRGFWHYPTSQMPGKRGNVVIIGHRFDKLPPNTETFFNLDKVVIGDKIIIEQSNSEFTYTVVKTKVVEKNDRSVLGNSDSYVLTLLTCTPLWSADQRLMILAVQDRLYNVI